MDNPVIINTININTIWLILSGALVFFMNAGFALLETGFCRTTNAVNVLAKNLIVFCVAIFAFWLLGFNLMFGDGSADCLTNNNPTIIDGLVGRLGTFQLTFPNQENPLGTVDGFSCLLDDWQDRSFSSLFFFQLVFAGTAATIVSGAVAERIKFFAFFWFSFFLVAIIYPIAGHWVWSHYGWLNQLGFKDFAGSAVVHSVGGTAALVGAYILKPRWKRLNYEPQEELLLRPNQKLQPPSQWSSSFDLPNNPTYITLGCLILWLGWLGFNAGSTTDLRYISHVITTTLVSAAGGGIVTTLSYTSLTEGKKPTIGSIINGILGGLVGITASSAYVNIVQSAIIGIISGFVVIKGENWLEKWKIDDPVSAVPVHLFCGAWGTLAVGIFGDPNSILYNPSGHSMTFINIIQQTSIQLIGWLAIFGYTAIFSLLFLSITSRVVGQKKLKPVRLNFIEKFLRRIRHGIRVSVEEEINGSDGLFYNYRNN